MMEKSEICEFKSLTNYWKKKLKGKHMPGFTNLRPNDDQIFNLQSKDKRYLELLTDVSMEKIIKELINDPYYGAMPKNYPNYILGEYIYRKSSDSLRLHIDSWMPAPGPLTWMIQVAFALDERKKDDGCTIVVPGSHLTGEYTQRDFQNVVYLEAKPGDVIIWDSRLWHGAGENKTEKEAAVLVATLQRWWVKQRFDIPNTISSEMMSKLSDKEKVLLGLFSVPPIDEFHGTNIRQGYLDKNKEI